MTLIRKKWPQIALIWTILAIAMSLAALREGDWPRIIGDDAMRLVTALDLLDGQPWLDTIQYRDNAPFGASMHWSRLIDALLVLLIALFQPIVHDAAPYWAAFVWPLIVLFVAIVLIAALTERVAGRPARLATLALLATSYAIYTEFSPGRVDHHNIQIALTLATIILSLDGRLDPRSAVAAGLVAATGIAIGTEILPTAVAALLCFALYWVFEPRRSARPFLAFATAFVVGMVLHMLASAPVESWFTAACDALSITYVMAGVCYAMSAMVVVLLTPVLRHWAVRLAVLAVLGALCLLAVVLMFPECRYGPYGNLDADLARILLTDVVEAQSVVSVAVHLPQYLSLAVTPVLGMLALLAAVAVAPKERRWAWLVLSGFCLALFIVFCLQIRGFRLLAIALLPAFGFFASRIWAWFQSRQTLAAASLTCVALIAFTGSAHWSGYNLLYSAFAPAEVPEETANSRAFSDWEACLAREAYRPLAALPPGNLMSYMLIGPQLLLETPHSIVSAGYHRNEDGLRDMVRFYGGGEAEARAVAERRGLDYLVFCRGLPPNGGLEGVPAFEGLDWPWLKPISDPDADLQIYAIDLPVN